MDECKWNFKILNHYVRFTKANRFIILGQREEQWRELVNINFSDGNMLAWLFAMQYITC